MKHILVFVFGMLSLSASAQWYRIDLKLKKPVHLPAIHSELGHSVARFPVIALNNITPEIADVPDDQYDHSNYIIKAEEAIMIKTAQRNMKYGIYTDAS